MRFFPGSGFGMLFLGRYKEAKGNVWWYKVGSFFTSVENPGTSFLMLFCLGGEVISRNIFEGFLN